jgi:hypothetical protein
MLSAKRVGPIVAGSLVLIVALIVAVRLRRPGIPYHEGRSFYQWAAAVRSPARYSPEDQQKNRDVLRALTPRALPVLIAELRADRPSFQEQAATWWNQHLPYPKFRVKSLRQRWHEAAFALEMVGSEAAPYLADLTFIATNNPDFGPEALMAAGPSALPAFSNLLVHAGPPLDDRLVVAFCNAMGAGRVTPDGAAPLIPLFVDALRVGTGGVRTHVPTVLGAIRRRPDLCIPVLLVGLDDPDPGFREAVAMALTEFPEAAEALLPRLTQRYDHGPAATRIEVCQTILRLRPVGDLPQAATLALRAIRDPDEEVRLAGVYALHRVAPREDALQVLEECATDPSPAVREGVFRVIGAYQTNALAFAPILRQATNDPDPDTRDAAARALKRVLGLPAGIPPRKLDRSSPVPTE